MHVSSLASPLSLDPTSNSDSYDSINNNNNINSYYNKPNNNNLNLYNYLPQFLITGLILGLGLLQLFRSKYFAAATTMSAGAGDEKGCAVCGDPAKSRCSGCRTLYYCSHTCQSKHWKSEHQAKCKRSSGRLKSQQHKNGNRNSSIALVPLPPDKLVDKVLFSYDVFIKLFNWDLPTFAPCGLLNCGNSCFANVVLQCLAHTRPLMAYLLKKGHRRNCRRNEWCFLCELEAHVERAINSQLPFSPINILSHLPIMGGNMGYGRQEDAHEFMRFAIDMMQSVCLDEHGGEKLVLPKSRETTLIQHIFGGQLRSQVKCTRCSQVSDRYENMLDLTVEIHGEVTSLQECLDQFTEAELLHGENKYQCDRCKDYVIAHKRLTIHQAPNILTVTLKRFEGGNFGKINKKVTFSESLDLCPFMSEKRDGADTYELYAVVVHMDLLNASYFGHYICYTKGFQGDWYWIDDCKVTRVDIDEVLSQGAYMLMYKRISARPKCLKTSEVGMNKEREGDKRATTVADGISRSRLPSSSNSSDLCMSEREGDKMATVAENISPSQLPSSSNSSDPCMNMECEGDKMATVADDNSPSQLPSSSNSLNLCPTTDDKKQLEPLVPLSLAVREAIDQVSEYAFTVLPMSDECKLSEPAFNKKQLMDPKEESSDAEPAISDKRNKSD
ncbi:ubiquitin carboxyl-terminal hydrolase 18-like [Silene latifolia]|uniref:ubiquitin carboxyl-terminal hydrolase 18-like n=1 Tax=Silene latifolia TaxID=37657 RepID=UPI003D76D05C